MDSAILEQKYNLLYKLAYQVRHHQILYYKHKSSKDLDKARYYERQLDKILKAEEKEKNSPQQQLF